MSVTNFMSLWNFFDIDFPMENDSSVKMLYPILVTTCRHPLLFTIDNKMLPDMHIQVIAELK